VRRMPPLNALKAFEAAARLSGITAAAEEMNVTHSAVSQQIRVLEDYFGRKLFTREGRSILPTREAVAFLEDIRASFDRIAIASEQLARKGNGRVLTINATPSFAMRWLIPQTSSFQLEHPSIELRIATSTSDGIDQLGEPYDFIIRREAMKRPEHECRRIVDDISTVLVAPALMTKHPLPTPRALLDLPLLHLKSRPHAWRHWFAAHKIETGEIVAGTWFDHFFLSLQAAINGLGAAIGPYALVEDDLANNRLVAPFPDLTLVGSGFHVLYRTATAKDRAARLFLDWLMAKTPG
jgi:LysR family glycine cleavage system transcriptional activator